MKLVSFDVGLRNLAFCVMEGTNRSNLKITHWDLIDVMSESAGLDAIKCFKCKKPANWTNTTEYACSLHKPKSIKPPTKTSLNKKSLEDLNKEAKQIFRTKKDAVNFIVSCFKTSNWKRCVKSTKSMSVVDLADPIASCLEARKDIWKDANLIAFEQQPDKRMLCVQAMLHMWFVCAGYRCRGVSASHKLTNMITTQDSTKTYKGRKKTGILHATELVPTAEWREYMSKHPKKDDLADCFLQGLWVMENGRLNGVV